MSCAAMYRGYAAFGNEGEIDVEEGRFSGCRWGLATTEVMGIRYSRERAVCVCVWEWE